jgi:hypothetical protein
MKLTESSRKSFLCAISYAYSVTLLLSCATTPPVPDWAQSPSAIAQVYPAAAYIAQRGRGQTRQAAETAAAAEIARYFTSQISANSSYRTSISEQNGVSNESAETETSAFVSSEINLFGIRYAQDAPFTTRRNSNGKP